MAKTRSGTDDVIVGQPAKLPNRQVSTKLDVLKAYLFKLNLAGHDDKQVKSETYSELVDEIVNIWNLASLPHTSSELILKNVQYLIEKYTSFSYSLNTKRDNKLKIEKFRSEMNFLFDVCSCRCFKSKFGKPVDWNDVKFTDCFCVSLDCKIPGTEWDFYVDQQLNRKFFISYSVDKAASEQLRRRKLKIDRQKEQQKSKSKLSSNKVRLQKSTESVQSVHTVNTVSTISHSELVCDYVVADDEDMHEFHDELDEDYKKEVAQNRVEYPNLIAAAKRFRISNHAVCVLGNAMLQDLGISIFLYRIKKNTINCLR